MTHRGTEKKRSTEPYSRSENPSPEQGTTLVSMVSNPLENSQERHKTVTWTISELNLNTMCASAFMTVFICHKPPAITFIVCSESSVHIDMHRFELTAFFCKEYWGKCLDLLEASCQSRLNPQDYVEPWSRPIPYSQHSPHSHHFVQHLAVLLQGF